MSVALSSSPSPRRGQERLQRRLVAPGHGPRPRLLVALGVEQVLVQRARLEDLALLGRRRLQQPRVDLRQRLLHRQLAGPRPLQQRAELEQLHVAHDGVRDVQVGVEAQLAEPPADLRDRRQQLVAQEPERGLQRLRPARTAPPRAPPTRRRPRPAPPRRTATAAAPRRGPSSPGRRARAASAPGSSPRAAAAASRRRASARDARRHGLLEQRVGDRLQGLPPRPGHPRAHQARARRRARTRGPSRRASSSRARRGRPRGSVASSSRRPGVGHGGDRARELPRRGLRRAPHVRAPPAPRSARGCAAARRPRSSPRTAAAGAGRAARSGGARRGPGAWCRSRPRRSGRA